ncbi:hypothetical protein LXL04_012634 [Taraxacum kok-saghyz]
MLVSVMTDINSFVNRSRRDCKTGLLNRQEVTIDPFEANVTPDEGTDRFKIMHRIQLQHKFWQPNVQQNSITAQFNYNSIQLQQNSITAHSIPQHYNQPNSP